MVTHEHVFTCVPKYTSELHFNVSLKSVIEPFISGPFHFVLFCVVSLPFITPFLLLFKCYLFIYLSGYTFINLLCFYLSYIFFCFNFFTSLYYCMLLGSCAAWVLFFCCSFLRLNSFFRMYFSLLHSWFLFSILSIFLLLLYK